MTIAAMRERAHELIDEATDGEIPFMLEDLKKAKEPYKWWEDEEFLADLDERGRRYKTGVDRGYTLEEVKAELEKMKAARLTSVGK